MKKLIYAVMLLLGMSVFMTSCEKEGGDNGNSSKYSKLIIGTWKVVKAEYLWEDGTTEPAKVDDDDIFTFKGNGVMEIYGTSLPYQMDGNKVIILIDNYTIEKLTKDELVWKCKLLDSDNDYKREYLIRLK